MLLILCCHHESILQIVPQTYLLFLHLFLATDICDGQTGFTFSLEDPVKLTGENKSPT
eukprot:COSAG01_NODE_76303_length_187_cov_44.465909_1_plen_57_part_01